MKAAASSAAGRTPWRAAPRPGELPFRTKDFPPCPCPT